MGAIERSLRKTRKGLEKTFTGSTSEDRREARRDRDAAIAKADVDNAAAHTAQAALDDAKVKAAAAEADKLRVTEELKKAESELKDLEPGGTESGATSPTSAENTAAKTAQVKAKVLALKAELEVATLSVSKSTTLVEETTVSAQSAQTQAEASQRAADEATKKVKSLNSGGVGGALRGAMAAFSNGLEKAVNCISTGLKAALKFISKAVDKLMEIGVMLLMNSPIMLLVKLAAPDIAKKIEKVVEKMADAVGSVIKDTLTAAVSVVDSVGKSVVALSRGDLKAAGKTLTTGVMDAAMVAATVAGGFVVLAETAVVSILSEVLPPEAAGALGVLATLNPRGAIGNVVKTVDNFIPSTAISGMAGGVKNVTGDASKLVPTTGMSKVAGDAANAAGDVVDKGLEAMSALAQMMPVGELTPMQMLAAEIGLGAAASQAPSLLEKRRKGKDNDKRDHDDTSDDKTPKDVKTQPRPDESTKANGNEKAESNKNKNKKEKDEDKPDRDFDFLGLASSMFDGVMGGGMGDGMESGATADPVEQKQFMANYGGNIAEAARSDPSNTSAPAPTTTTKPKNGPGSGVHGMSTVSTNSPAKKGAEVKV